MKNKLCHLLYVPFVGLGNYGGWRGERWFRNRIKIFRQFVVPSLLNQTNKNFILWISFLREQKRHPLVKELKDYLDKSFKSIFTYSGICFYDDKYPDEVARDRLVTSLHNSMGELLDVIGEVDYVYMTIQPSDDCYYSQMIEEVQEILKQKQACGYGHGLIMNYLTGEVADYNPLTNPPFYTIKFPRDIFTDPLKHLEFTALKHDVGKYKKGTPLPSHEYLKDVFPDYEVINKRGFLVGCHTDNISTFFNHPYKGEAVGKEILKDFGLDKTERLKLKFSFRKWLFGKLPFKVQRKLRWWAGEKRWILRPFFALIYNLLRR